MSFTLPFHLIKVYLKVEANEVDVLCRQIN